MDHEKARCTLPRASAESERRYRFKIALAWVVVVALCVLGCLAVRGAQWPETPGVALRIFGFVAALMALQAFLSGVFRAPGKAR
jgi:phosphatidylserine synthase